jgi:uncharacterized repeat protein (TIGR03803 family)
MHSREQFCTLTSSRADRSSELSKIALALLCPLFLLVFMTLTTAPLQAQSYFVIHDFMFTHDSAFPAFGVTMDNLGNLYGSTETTVFKMAPGRSGGWSFSTLYSFTGPSAPEQVLVGPNNTLFGTTFYGGNLSCDPDGCGTVFALRPEATAGRMPYRPWSENVLHAFSGGAEGKFPYPGLVADANGNLYGTTISGGGGACNGGCGTIFSLTTSEHLSRHRTRTPDSTWTATTLYSFTGGNDGEIPEGGVVAYDGKLYGTASLGGSFGWGVVYELSPSGSGWTQNVIYAFEGQDDGEEPQGGVIVDAAGNLYGTTAIGGSSGGGTAFKLVKSNDTWTFQLIYSFTAGSEGPNGSLVLDAAHNVYGITATGGAFGYGSVFELMPSGDAWTYRTLHDFCQFCNGSQPAGELLLDSQGNLYGTAAGGGNGSCTQDGCGVVWEITP